MCCVSILQPAALNTIKIWMEHLNQLQTHTMTYMHGSHNFQWLILGKTPWLIVVRAYQQLGLIKRMFGISSKVEIRRAMYLTLHGQVTTSLLLSSVEASVIERLLLYENSWFFGWSDFVFGQLIWTNNLPWRIFAFYIFNLWLCMLRNNKYNHCNQKIDLVFLLWTHSYE